MRDLPCTTAAANPYRHERVPAGPDLDWPHPIDVEWRDLLGHPPRIRSRQAAWARGPIQEQDIDAGPLHRSPQLTPTSSTA